MLHSAQGTPVHRHWDWGYEMANEYAQYVDYTQMQGFKDMMVEVGRRTRGFALRRGFEIIDGYRASYWCYVGGLTYINRTLLQPTA